MKRSFNSLNEKNFKGGCKENRTNFEENCDLPEFDEFEELDWNESRELVPYELEVISTNSEKKEFDYSLVPQGIVQYIFFSSVCDNFLRNLGNDIHP